MTINGWDISNADAKQWNVTPGFHEVSNESEWTDGCIAPVFFNNRLGFKSITVTLLVKTSGGRQAVLSRCSDILSHLLAPAEISLDKFDHFFYGILTKYSHEEKAMNRWHTLSLEFDGYEYAEEVTQTFSGVSEMTVTNPGNIVTPMIFEITPQFGASELNLTGVCRDPITGSDLPVVVANLTTGNAVTLDGETGLFTENGELKTGDLEIWDLPSLAPGENKITLDNTQMDISVKFHPRFM